MDKLRTRFVAFNMLVISVILIMITMFVFFGSPSNISVGRLFATILISLGLVFVGSLLISKIALAPIKEAWQKQLDFTANASHELRTPLAVIQSNLELVMDNSNETVQSQKKWLDYIHAENIRMTKLVEDLLTLSRTDTNIQTLDFTTFMLDEAIREAVLPFEPVANSKKISLNIIANQHISFWGDRGRIKQLLIILTDNALKYSEELGNIEIVLSRNRNKVKITVSDKGMGIATEHLEKIFNRFYRIEETRKKNKDGSGLGLSIAQWIVHEHGGALYVESILGKGAKFFVILPIKQAI